MATHDINRLVGEFMELYQEWEDGLPGFDWQRVRALAAEGAQAYNEGRGPSFHILAFDGYPLGEFHERFLGYLLDAGFDPFKTLNSANGAHASPAFNHEDLEQAAQQNPAAARMLERMRGMAHSEA
jgi:hypothetical protein